MSGAATELHEARPAEPAPSPREPESFPEDFDIERHLDEIKREYMAAALERAGVDVIHRHEPSLPHGFITMTRVCSEARACLDAIAGRLRKMA